MLNNVSRFQSNPSFKKDLIKNSKFNNMKFKINLSAVILLLSFSFLSCNKNDDDNDPNVAIYGEALPVSNQKEVFNSLASSNAYRIVSYQIADSSPVPTVDINEDGVFNANLFLELEPCILDNLILFGFGTISYDDTGILCDVFNLVDTESNETDISYEYYEPFLEGEGSTYIRLEPSTFDIDRLFPRLADIKVYKDGDTKTIVAFVQSFKYNLFADIILQNE